VLGMTRAAPEPPARTHPYDFGAGFDDPLGKNAWFAERIGRGKQVLEMGCATGYVGEYLVRELGNAVVGVELVADAAARARSRLVYSHVIEGDLEDDRVYEALDAFHSSFDFILFGDVLEHIKEPAEVLRRVQPYLKPNGHVLVCVPNIVHWSMRARILFGRFDYSETGTLDRTHLRFFTPRSARELAAISGYAVASEGGVVWLPRPLLVLPTRWTTMLSRLSGRRFPNMFWGQVLLDLVPVA
jgi:2-polyprenyl-3-methyl-5-hydroxy-6-metoxy-1,4-benzoquinol methylase